MAVVVSYTVYILHFSLISPGNCANCRPKHVAHVMNIWTVEYLWCYIYRVTVGYVYLFNSFKNNFIKGTSDTIDLQ
jgi:hypothetical protein